ncbi:Lipase (class 3) family protein [Leishmania donovani]|uniref:Lipase (Class 3) family protein n=2 Tax=Leishmania donovani TaxID=5661 RepID=A0A504X936_LEIDO|nr:Lipase (class 3) family protein [Leishmania donovani]
MYRVPPTLRAVCGVCAVLCVQLASEAVTQKPYSFHEAWRAHFFSRASYCDMRRVQSWTCSSACGSVAAFELTAVMNHIITGAGGFVGVDHATQQIAVAFRGTGNIQSILAGINVLLAKYDKSSSCGSQCEVHNGFYASYMSLRQQTRDAVLKLIRKGPTYEILATGHSLGGAMALLAAADLQERLNNLESSSDLKPVPVYTFGAPRVGNAAFAEWVDSLLAKGAKYRITHAGDPVVLVPARTWGYVHSTSEVFYKTRSNHSCDVQRLARSGGLKVHPRNVLSWA